MAPSLALSLPHAKAHAYTRTPSVALALGSLCFGSAKLSFKKNMFKKKNKKKNRAIVLSKLA